VGKSRLAMEMAGYASRVGFRCSVGHLWSAKLFRMRLAARVVKAFASR